MKRTAADGISPFMTTRGFRILLAIFLAVSLGAGGALAAAAHAAAMSARSGAVEIVICAADGSTATIVVDRDGNPVERQKPCPAASCPECLPPQATAIPVSDFVLAVGSRADCCAPHSPLRPAERIRMDSNSARAPPTGEPAA